MRFLMGFSLTVFIVAAILLILAILIQNDQGESLGGLFAGSSNSVFGSQGSNVLQRFTSMLAVLLFISAITFNLSAKEKIIKVIDPASDFLKDADAKPWWQEKVESDDNGLVNNFSEKTGDQ